MADQHARLDRATAGLDAPVAVVDLDAFDANAADLERRAAGTPIRVASKSVRCRALLRRVLARPGFAGVLAFTAAEALWLAQEWDDVLVAYPSAQRGALARLAADPEAAARVTLMVDSPENLDLLRSVIGGVLGGAVGGVVGATAPVRVCLDLDASLHTLADRVHLGPRRSPVRSPADAVALARTVVDDPAFTLVGLMAYEGQVAGLADRTPGNPVRGAAVRAVKRASVAELARRRAAVVAAVREVADLELVNGGGTGSVESTTAEGSVTEVAAGSGLYGPGLFDAYDTFRPRPAAFFGLDVVRRPGPGMVTVAGGGWIASGAAGRDRLPLPTYPPGLRLLPAEGAGEVQTPLRGAAADRLHVGDRVWFRHAKAGELSEHVTSLHLVSSDEGGVVEEVPTYRGERQAFL